MAALSLYPRMEDERYEESKRGYTKRNPNVQNKKRKHRPEAKNNFKKSEKKG